MEVALTVHSCPECQILQAFRCSDWLFYNTAGWNPVLEVPEYVWLTVILWVSSLEPLLFALVTLKAGQDQIYSRVRINPSALWLLGWCVQIETLQGLQYAFSMFQRGRSETSKFNLSFPSPLHSCFLPIIAMEELKVETGTFWFWGAPFFSPSK